MEAPTGDFSPLKMARAGRRAGRNVAIANTSTSGDDAEAAGPVPSLPSTQQPSQQPSQGHQNGTQQQADQQIEFQQQLQSVLEQLPQHKAGASVDASAARPPAGPPLKRVGFAGLSEDDTDRQGSPQQCFTGVSRRKKEQMELEQIAENRHKDKYDERAIEGVTDIPELEEEGKEDITHVVAQAPKSSGPRIQAISELEQDQAWVPTRPDSVDIDLSLLTAHLLPSEQVIEPPDVWDYDLLFSQLKAELQQEAMGAVDTYKDGGEDLRQI